MLRPLCLILLTLAPFCRADVPASQPARDDAPALARQLNRSSAVVTLAPGAYRVSSPIALTSVHDLTVFAYNVRLTADKTQPATANLSDTLRLVNCRNVRIAGLSIDGNATSRGKPLPSDSSQASMGIWGGDSITITDCRFTGAVNDDVFVCSSNGVACTDLATAPQWVTLRGNTHCGPAYRQQLSIVHGRHVLATGCKFANQTATYTGTALDIEANPGDAAGVLADVRVTDCDFVGCTQGVTVNGVASPAGISIEGNRFAGGRRGILNGAVGATIARNTLSGLAGIGIVNNAPATRVLDNTLTGGSDIAIYLNPGGGSGVLIAGNTITDYAQPSPTQSPWVVQTRFGGGGETLVNNAVKFTKARPDLIGFLSFAPFPAAQNTAVGCPLQQ